MSFKVILLTFSVLTISVLGVYFGDATKTKVNMAQQEDKEVRVKLNPEGTLEEQIAYHLSEIDKFKDAAMIEEGKANKYLMENQLNEVRQANSRKYQYQKKVEDHNSAIERLKSLE